MNDHHCFIFNEYIQNWYLYTQNSLTFIINIMKKHCKNAGQQAYEYQLKLKKDYVLLKWVALKPKLVISSINKIPFNLFPAMTLRWLSMCFMIVLHNFKLYSIFYYKDKTTLNYLLTCTCHVSSRCCQVVCLIVVKLGSCWEILYLNTLKPFNLFSRSISYTCSQMFGSGYVFLQVHG